MARLAALALAILTQGFAQQGPTVRIPSGPFEMGRSHELPDDHLKWFPQLLRDDRPVRTVTLGAFDIDMHEVTNREYAKFVEAGFARTPHYWPDGRFPEAQGDQPAANVTWDEADAYCRWTGRRLPTEAEWEKSCRGGLEAQKYPWGDEEASPEKAHYDSVQGPKAVCTYENNAYGLCDMAGNVWEWTADLYAKEYYADGPAEDPQGPPDGRYRVLRGGSWADVPKFLTCAHRSFSRPEERSPNIGFRCVRTVEESPQQAETAQ